MIIEDQKFLKYFFIKAVNALIFSDDYDYVFEKIEQIFDIDSSSLLNAIYAKLPGFHDIIDDTMKENIYKVVHYFRHEYKCDDEEKDNITMLCNNIVNIANSATTNKVFKFVSYQLKKRGFSTSSRLMALSVLQDAFIDVKDLIVMDFNILCLHSDLCSNDTYEEAIPDLINENLPCMYCLNIIFSECPELLNDPVFRQRVLITNSLLENNVIYNGENSEIPYKTLIKEHDKYKKNFLKLI